MRKRTLLMVLSLILANSFVCIGQISCVWAAQDVEEDILIDSETTELEDIVNTENTPEQEEVQKETEINESVKEDTEDSTTVVINGITYMLDLSGESYTVTGCADNVVIAEIESIVNGKNVTSIKSDIFYECNKLTKIVIPETYTDTFDERKRTIQSVFRCPNLIDIEVKDGNPNYSSFNGVLYNKDKSCLLFCPRGRVGRYEIPDGVTRIQASAFNACIGLAEISIPDGVTLIEEYTFSYCTALKTISLPKSISGIDKRAFDGCLSLEYIVIPDNTTYIGESAFRGCDSLESISIPGSVKDVNQSAFENCTKLTNVTIGEGVENIGSLAFQESGIELLYVPASVKNLEISYCPNLKEIIVDGVNDTYRSENGVLYTNDVRKLLWFPAGKDVEVYILPESVEEIENMAFSGAGIKKIIIGSGFTGDVNVETKAASYYPFSGAAQLQEIEVSEQNPSYASKGGCLYSKDMAVLIMCPAGRIETVINEGTEQTNSRAFFECTNLKSIVIPESVTVINSPSWRGAFSDCENLTIKCYANSYAEQYAIQNGINYEVIEKKVNEPQIKEISNCTMILDSVTYIYDGSTKTPAVTIKDGDRILAKDADYAVIYSNNINAGTATVAVTGKGNYTGTRELTFTIKAKEISTCSVALDATSYTYDGHEKKPSVIIRDGDTMLDRDNDYTIAYANNINVGTATIIITGKGNYINTKEQEFAIVAKEISFCTASLKTTSYIYNGSARKPAVTVKDGATVLKSDTDYKVCYSNNINAGTATVTIKGKGSYTGSEKLTFKINPKKISDCTVSAVADQYYTGKVIKPSVTVKSGSAKLVKDTDYKISYSNNKEAGTATISIKGKGNYTGSVKDTFKIVKKVSNVKVSSAGYDSVQISWSKIKGVTGYKVYRSTNKNGKFKLIFTIKEWDTTSYKDTKLTAGKTYYYKITPYKSSKNGLASKVVSAKPVPAKVNISSLKNASSKTATVTWDKVPGASGYEIYRSTSKDGTFSKMKNVSSGSTTTYKNTKLSKGKTYYYKVRAFRMINDKKVYGSYSDITSVKIKK